MLYPTVLLSLSLSLRLFERGLCTENLTRISCVFLVVVTLFELKQVKQIEERTNDDGTGRELDERNDCAHKSRTYK